MRRLLRCRPNRFGSFVAKALAICIMTAFIFIIYQINLSIKSAFDRTIQNHEIMHQHQNEGHIMCILIPFRDRFEELTEFVPRITHFLDRQNVKHKIVVINQVDEYRFNRASLLNVGFRETDNTGCDYLALHDVDLIPINHKLTYLYPSKGPCHIAAPGLHPKYDYPDFLGGILLITRHHFLLVNGMSNHYWGWGLEDDEFRARLRDANLEIKRPSLDVVTTGVKGTFQHYHLTKKRKRDNTKCYNQWEITRKRDRKTGLDTLDYSVINVHNLTVEENPFTLLNVKLNCDKSLTPWCDCTDAPASQRGMPKVSKHSKRL